MAPRERDKLAETHSRALNEGGMLLMAKYGQAEQLMKVSFFV